MSAISVSLLTTRSIQQSHFSLLPPCNLRRPFSVQFPACNGRHYIPPQVSNDNYDQLTETTPSTELSTSSTMITVENEDNLDSTLFLIRARNKIGLLQVITRVFKVLGLKIERAIVEFEGEYFDKSFFVVDSEGKKIEDNESVERIKKALMDAIDGGDSGGGGGGAGLVSGRGVVVRKAGLGMEFGERKAKVEKMFGLMDVFLKNDSVSLQKDILDHVEFTVARSRFSFDDFEAYQVVFLLTFFFLFLFFFLLFLLLIPLLVKSIDYLETQFWLHLICSRA